MAQAVEIWIRLRGARRQAFYRRPGVGMCWQAMPVPAADKALRSGRLTIDDIVDAPVVPRETQLPAVPPAATAFSQLAASLSRDIDNLNAAARGAA